MARPSMADTPCAPTMMHPSSVSSAARSASLSAIASQNRCSRSSSSFSSFDVRSVISSSCGWADRCRHCSPLPRSASPQLANHAPAIRSTAGRAPHREPHRTSGFQSRRARRVVQPDVDTITRYRWWGEPGHSARNGDILVSSRRNA